MLRAGSPAFPGPAHGVRPARLMQHCISLRLGSPSLGLRRALRAPRPLCAVQGGQGADAEGGSPGSAWQLFWGAVDAGAWLGAVGTAVAFVLTQEAMLVAGPVVLPLLALFASRQRERLALEVSQSAFEAQVQRVISQVGTLSEEAAAEAGAEVRRAMAAEASPRKVLKALEAKLSAVEGSVLSAGATTREALRESASAAGRSSQDLVARVEALASAVRRDVAAEVRQASGEELAALGRLEARMAALEASLGGLEGSQAEGFRRLGGSLQSALQGAEESLGAAVRSEARRSLEPVRRLPELLAAAMPVTPEVVMSPDGLLGGGSEEALRALLGEALGAATSELLEQQAALLAEAREAPQTLAPAQWNQLGRRLLALDEQLAAVREAQAAQGAAAAEAPGSSSAGGGAVAELRAQLGALREELAALTAAVQRSLAAAPASGGAASGSPAAAALEPFEAALAAFRSEVGSAIALAATDARGDRALLERLEERMAAALAPVQDALAALRDGAKSISEPAAGPSGTADAVAAQQAALAAAVAALGSVGSRLDGLGEQLVALQRSVEAAAATWPPPPPRQQQGAAEAEVAEKEGAYQRMQALLASRPAAGRAAEGEQEDRERSAGVPIASWLSPSQDGPRSDEARKPVPTAAGGSGSRNGASASNGSGSVSEGGGDGVPAISENIMLEAGLAMGPWDEEQALREVAAEEAAEAAAAAVAAQEAAASSGPVAEAGPSSSQSASRGAAAAAAAAGDSSPVDEQYQRGLERLRYGRGTASTPGADLGLADAALWEAAEAFEGVLARDPGNVRARGNYGNALMAHGALKKGMLDTLRLSAPPLDSPGAAAVASAERTLAAEAQELLLLAGRQYKGVLEADPGQARAFLNWGRVVCLRAELARDRDADPAAAAALFVNAADKFDAALDLDPQSAATLRLAGLALADAASALAGADPRQARSLLGDAEAYLESAAALDGGDAGAEARLGAARAALAAARQQQQRR